MAIVRVASVPRPIRVVISLLLLLVFLMVQIRDDVQACCVFATYLQCIPSPFHVYSC